VEQRLGRHNDTFNSLDTLVRLRWLAWIGQVATALVVSAVWSFSLPWLPLGAFFGVLAASNIIVPRLEKVSTENAIGALLLLDVLLLTGVLAVSGGPSNPFSVLYLVNVTLAATISTRRWTWTVVAASSAGFALLFVFSIDLPPALGGHAHHMPTDAYSVHLQGMWLAYTVAAIAIGFFVSRLSDTLRRERERQARTSRLLGLAALAAGAAHEIGNPLGTIRIAAGELERELAMQGAAQELVADASLINREVARAKAVLDRMATAAGELVGEVAVPIEMAVLLERSIVAAGASPDSVSIDIAAGLPEPHWPREASIQAISQLVRNALDATHGTDMIRVRAFVERGWAALEIKDEGEGMGSDVLARIGEPFFSTRPAKGTGLGVFIARSLVERMGGSLHFSSEPGVGTTVSIRLPFRLQGEG
jgi:two-component system sensor histidine kinase RegB